MQTIITGKVIEVEYIDGVTEDAVPLSAEQLSAITANGTRKVRNLRKPNEDETAAGAVAVLVNRKARPRKVALDLTDGTRTTERASGAIVQTIRRVTVLHERAASLAGLTPELAHAFGSRFDPDGATLPAPSAKMAEKVTTAFRAVNALKGQPINFSIAGKAQVETLA